MKWRVAWMMNRMSFQVISSIFCDFQQERDRPTNQPTNQPRDRGSYRGAMAHLKTKQTWSATMNIIFLFYALFRAQMQRNWNGSIFLIADIGPSIGQRALMIELKSGKMRFSISFSRACYEKSTQTIRNVLRSIFRSRGLRFLSQIR